MPYYKLVAQMSCPLKSNGFMIVSTWYETLSIVHHRGALGLIFSVLLVTGGSEQVALDRPVLKFLSMSDIGEDLKVKTSRISIACGSSPMAGSLLPRVVLMSLASRYLGIPTFVWRLGLTR